jgi:hypothetical protein
MKRALFYLMIASCALRGDSTTEATEPPAVAEVKQAVSQEPEAAPPKTSEPKIAAKKSGDLGKYRTIIDRAPFRNTLVPTALAGAPAGSSTLRLNGIIRIGSRLLAGIEDVGQQRSLILAVGQNDQGIEIQSIDEANQTVTLTHNGQSATLLLEKTPSIGPAPALMAGAAPGAPYIPPQPAPAYGSPPGMTNAAPAAAQPNNTRRRRLILPRTQ